jgi:molecular chaperone HscB
VKKPVSDPFDALELEPRFALDLGLLERRHRELSKALHPDRYVDAPPAERRLALTRAIAVNEAFRALRDPLTRGEALLARLGAPVEEAGEGAPKASPAFLMEVLELREELAEAGKRRDRARLRALVSAMEEKERACLAALALALDGREGAPPDPARARASLGELRFAKRFLDEASLLEEEALS